MVSHAMITGVTALNLPQEDVFQLTEKWLRAGHKLALASIISTWGSAPRPAGSQMAVREDCLFAGSVSGGCVEAAVVAEAQALLKQSDAKPKLLEFGVDHGLAWEAGLACGGEIRVLIEAFDNIALLNRLNACRNAGNAAIWLLSEQKGSVAIFEAGQATPWIYEGEDISDIGRAALAKDRPTRMDRDKDVWHFIPFNPPLRLAVIGAVHIAQSLIPMARYAGYQVTLIDPRPSFANKNRFPSQNIDNAWPDEALRRFKPDARSAVVSLSHDPKLDDPALIAALTSSAFYIAALGSKKTHAARLERLTKAGLAPAMLARIHGPAGLAISAASPGEIAISILAQMTQSLRQAGHEPSLTP